MEGIIIGLGVFIVCCVLGALLALSKYISPIILVIGCLWLMAASLAHNGMQALLGIGIIASAMVYYAIGACFEQP